MQLMLFLALLMSSAESAHVSLAGTVCSSTGSPTFLFKISNSVLRLRGGQVEIEEQAAAARALAARLEKPM